MNKIPSKSGVYFIALRLFRLLCVFAIAASASAASTLDFDLVDAASYTAYTEDKSPVRKAEISTKEELLDLGKQLFSGSASNGKYLAVRGASNVKNAERDNINNVNADSTESTNKPVTGRTADVIFIGDGSNVTTTRCLFLIIAGYLQSYPSFTEDTAYTAAQKICWWNSAHYGDTEYFEKLFGQACNSFADKTKSIGLSLSYKDWPGNTRIIIPWTMGDASVATEGDGTVDETLLSDMESTEDTTINKETPPKPLIESAKYVPKSMYSTQNDDTISNLLSVPSGFLILLGTVCLAIIMLVMLLIKVIMDLARDRG